MPILENPFIVFFLPFLLMTLDNYNPTVTLDARNRKCQRPLLNENEKLLLLFLLRCKTLQRY